MAGSIYVSYQNDASIDTEYQNDASIDICLGCECLFEVKDVTEPADIVVGVDFAWAEVALVFESDLQRVIYYLEDKNEVPILTVDGKYIFLKALKRL